MASSPSLGPWRPRRPREAQRPPGSGVAEYSSESLLAGGARPLCLAFDRSLKSGMRFSEGGWESPLFRRPPLFAAYGVWGWRPWAGGAAHAFQEAS